MPRTAKATKRRRSPTLSETPIDQEQLPASDTAHVAQNIRKPEAQEPTATYVVALDIGTTFSAAAISITRGKDIQQYSIQNYHDDEVAGRVGEQIPTESWYPVPNNSYESPDASSSSATLSESFEDRVCPGFLHGFGVQKILGEHDCAERGYLNKRRVSRMKLMFDSTTHDTTLESNFDFEEVHPTKLNVKTRRAYRNEAQAAKMRLNATARLLSFEGRITRQEDLLRDWLVPWFFHIKAEMMANHEYTESSPSTRSSLQGCLTLTPAATFAFSVPVCWKPEHNAILSTVIVEALRITEFGVSGPNDVPTIHMFNEAETAMTFVVHSESVPLCVRNILITNIRQLMIKQASEYVTVLDCGGGTIDGGSYEVSSCHPFRVEKEVYNTTGQFSSVAIW
jgi:hypothetical protein